MNATLVAGDSAGCNIALGAIRLALAEGCLCAVLPAALWAMTASQSLRTGNRCPAPCCQLLISPWSDLSAAAGPRGEDESMWRNIDSDYLSPFGETDLVPFFVREYLAPPPKPLDATPKAAARAAESPLLNRRHEFVILD